MKIKKRPKRLAAPLKRKVHVNGQEWTYSWAKGKTTYGYKIVGKFRTLTTETTYHGKVCILNPSKTKKWLVDYDGEPHRWDHASNDDYICFHLKPSWVKSYIEKNLVNEA